MASTRKVAVVTGSNKGIGFAIVRALCKAFDGDVFVTSRNEALGKQAVVDLGKEGFSPKYHQLDITDSQSIDKLKAFVKSNYGGIDILVNNAGIAYKGASTAPFSEQAEVSVKTNFLGTLDTCERLFPLLRAHSRVVNVSSMSGTMSLKKCSQENRKKLTDLSLTMEQLKTLMQSFVSAAKSDTVEDGGWSNSAYGTSKTAVTTMSLIQQRSLKSDPREDIVINACCPGYVATDMSSYKGHLTVDQGADTPVYLALLPPNTTSPKGNFVSERKVQEWK